MLKVIGFTEAVNPHVEIDYYIPLSFRCPAGRSFPSPLYWRTGDLKRTYIDIGLTSSYRETVPNRGAICKVTAESLGNVRHSENDDMCAAKIIACAVPICDTENWSPDRFVDVCREFTTTVGPSWVSISFEENPDIEVIYEAGSLQFGVNTSGFLSALKFVSLSDHDISGILSAGAGCKLLPS